MINKPGLFSHIHSFVMIAVIKGDIIASRGMEDQSKWLAPFKDLLSSWGQSPMQWELVWGDLFQLEIENPEEALYKAFRIKALIKKLAIEPNKATHSGLDIRMSIGIGEKTFYGTRISESNGPAFIFAGEQFDKLKKEKVNLMVKTSNVSFNYEMNLYLRLAGIFMDNWSVYSAELVDLVLQQPHLTQAELGEYLKIKQNSVSGRWNRSKIDELLEVETIYRHKLQQHLLS
ncbi:MAG: hypothetical protein RBR10_02400 [Bacteroidales bacterium]|jgi:hypothetical protein|nr:hypothetical protein [Bacteroidales bacterium]MDY0368680.1 hypothetical protein [Bacteroidales bacterium]